MAREDNNRRPKTKASDIYANSAVTKGAQRLDESRQRSFPNTRRAADEQATNIRQAEQRGGPLGRAVAGIQSLPALATGFGRDVFDTAEAISTPAQTALNIANPSQQTTRPPRAGARQSDGQQPQSAGGQAPVGEFQGITIQNGPRRGTRRGIPSSDPRGVALASTVNRLDQTEEGQRSALDEFAAANRIRQQAVDAQGGGGGGRISFIGGPEPGSIEDRQAQANDLLSRLDGRQSVPEEQAIRAQANALLGQAETAAQTDRTNLQQEGQTDRALLQAEIGQGRNEAIQQSALARAAGQQSGGLTPSGFKSLVDSGALAVNPDTGEIDLTDEDTAAIYQTLLQNIAPQGFAVENMAEGGIVPRADSAMALPALGRGGPALPPNEDVIAFQQMSESMRQMGLSPVDFESFLAMRQTSAPATAGQAPQGPELSGPAPSAIGMAEGGMVPDASGKMIVDSDPNAPTDSIPAVIDGQQPAALDSGEFVIPSDVVMFFGTDKLNKMIAAARKTETDGTESPNVGGSALQAALAAAGSAGSAPNSV